MTHISHNQLTIHETLQSSGDTSTQLGTLALIEVVSIGEQYQQDTEHHRTEANPPQTSQLVVSDEAAYRRAESYAAERKLAARNALLDIRDTQNLSDEELLQYIGLHTVMHSISMLRDPQIMITASYELGQAIRELQHDDSLRAA